MDGAPCFQDASGESKQDIISSYLTEIILALKEVVSVFHSMRMDFKTFVADVLLFCPESIVVCAPRKKVFIVCSISILSISSDSVFFFFVPFFFACHGF